MLGDMLVALLLSAIVVSSPIQRDFSAAISASRGQLEELLEREGIPGGVVAVHVGDELVWHEALGLAELDQGLPATIDTRYRVGSLTKLLTVAALLRLADAGRLALDDTVGQHLPDFPHGAITLRQLAGHLSGIRHYTEAEFLNQTRYASATEALRKFAEDPLLTAPGEKYFYSSYGYVVLGAVIERVTGKGFDAALAELVCVPLGMGATSFGADERTAPFYDASDQGPQPSPAIDLSDRLPAGAALSTAGDFARFLAGTTGEGFLTAASRDELLRPQHTADGAMTKVGLGWRIATDSASRTYLHHGGAVTGGRAIALVYPAERVGVVLVTNLGFAGFDDEDALLVALRFLE